MKVLVKKIKPILPISALAELKIDRDFFQSTRTYIKRVQTMSFVKFVNKIMGVWNDGKKYYD